MWRLFKTAAAVAAVFPVVVSAIGLPACAQATYDEVSYNVQCSLNDYACRCGDKRQKIMADASSRIIKNCGDRAPEIFNAINQACDLANVSISDSGPSTTTTTSARPDQISSPPRGSTPGLNKQVNEGGGLSTGSKAGIAVGATGGALFVGLAVFLLCRRRRRRSSSLRVIEAARNTSNDQVEKAELAGTGAEGGSRFDLVPKPELPAYQMDKRSSPTVAVAELEHREHSDLVPELDDHRDRRLETSVSGSPASTQNIPSGQPKHPSWNDDSTSNQPTLSPTPFSRTEPTLLPGPPPTAFDIYPIPNTKETAVEEETDFEYQARRLQERRAMIVERERLAEEKEQIAMEEEALRRKKAAKAGRA